MYSCFGLILLVNHACNLRCAYCYTGAKFNRPMPIDIGKKAIDRALASLQPSGTLELGFFGGEPLLEADLVAELMVYAREQAAARGNPLKLHLTTNGTRDDPRAWSLMVEPELDLTISFDGCPELHDRYRRFANGEGSSSFVLRTMRRLFDAGKNFSVNVVVRPESAASLPAGIAFLRSEGIAQVELSLDLWARWTATDFGRLEAAIGHCAQLWRDALPTLSINWFDEKAAQLAGVPIRDSARCGFGAGELAVTPAGNLYPCERLIGEDDGHHPLRLPGQVMAGDDFLDIPPAPGRSATPCSECAIQTMCNTTCRCGNYIRTGNIRQPDHLLSRWNQACVRETARVLSKLGKHPLHSKERMPHALLTPSLRSNGNPAAPERTTGFLRDRQWRRVAGSGVDLCHGPGNSARHDGRHEIRALEMAGA